MPSLKAKITREIVETNNLIELLPQKFTQSQFARPENTVQHILTYLEPLTVLTAAEMYHAEELEKFLKDFKEDNPMLLPMLISEESCRYVVAHHEPHQPF